MIPTIGYRGPFIVAIPLAFELVLVLVLSLLMNSAEEEIIRQRQARDIIDHCSMLSYDITSATSLTALSINLPLPGLSKRRSKAIAAIKRELSMLRSLAGKDTQQLSRLRKLSVATDNCLAELAFLQTTGKNGNLANYLGDTARFEHLHQLVTALGEPMNAFLRSASETDAESPAKQSRLKFLIMSSLAAGILVNIMLAIVMAVYTIRSITKPLSVLSDNTRRLTGRQALNPGIGGTDEISFIDQAFHEMHQHLESADKKRKLMSTLAAARLQEPLNRAQQGIIGMREGEFGPVPEAVLGRLVIAETGLLRITSLLYDLMNFEQMDRGSFIMNFRNCRLRPIVDRCAVAMHGYLLQKKLNLVANEFDMEIHADPDRIEQVLINLLSNAVKFSPAGEAITVDSKLVGEQVEVAVRDRGPGIPAEKISQIFEAYKQATAEDATVRGGFGLGLSICRTIVEQHGGQIGVESFESGSRFWFRIPALKNVGK